MREMAEFEKLTDIFKATEASLLASFFGPRIKAHCLIAHTQDQPDLPVAYIMWFHNYSSFLDKRGLYLEDLYVQPAHRGQGVGKMALKHRSEEHTSELQSLMRISYAVFCLKKKKIKNKT